MNEDTIVALSTAGGMSAIAVIRLSGSRAVEIVDSVFHSPKVGKKLSDVASHTAHFGSISDGNDVVDEVVATVFLAPHSFTGEDTVEVSCHGSVFIQQQLIQLFIRKGARMAMAGEYTRRAFVNGRMDLSQAEAVADLIASESYASHATAINQMRGGYSAKIKGLRESLLDLASLLELELDFSDQDVEFADRERLGSLLGEIKSTVGDLTDSFAVGNVIKNGIPVSIIGAPNVGKSTLLNALLGEERAIVSNVAGTTRDTVEDEIIISGLRFRFIDTAGLRHTDDVVEKMGIERTYKKISEAQIIIYMLDMSSRSDMDVADVIALKEKYHSKHVVVVANKVDVVDGDFSSSLSDVIKISAKVGDGLDALRERLVSFVDIGDVSSRTIVTNARHYDALVRSGVAIDRAETGLLAGLSADLLAVDVRDAISCLGEITGDISSDDILGSIFSRFCIGK
ncbi:MAG: tRNA uridine-5-carboxymethylaminomethyl(34) synthesis GTPase MnmE [Flavobacteriales bacterium]|nr:tRNA uridine-5-carboxymethylaminomethyl(34) synthesis GTPase MnmE [Flavobacteriales bacterium]